MRDSTSTARHTHIRTPFMRDARNWAEKLMNNEKTVDAALCVLGVMLCGWLVYCLASAFQRSAYQM